MAVLVAVNATTEAETVLEPPGYDAPAGAEPDLVAALEARPHPMVLRESLEHADMVAVDEEVPVAPDDELYPVALADYLAAYGYALEVRDATA